MKGIFNKDKSKKKQPAELRGTRNDNTRPPLSPGHSNNNSSFPTIPHHYPEHPSITTQHENSQDHSRTSSVDYTPSLSHSIFSETSGSARSIDSLRTSAAFSATDLPFLGGFHRGDKNEPQRPSDEEVERLFLQMMRKLDLGNLSEAMQAMPIENKWTLIKNNMLTEEVGISFLFKLFHICSNPLKNAGDPNTPEYYLKKIMDGTITYKHMNSLSVSLRTSPITWVKSFIEAKGLEVLANYLSSITKKHAKLKADLEMEYEIIKCLKSLLNNRWGAQEALTHASCIHSITFSLVSPQLNTRKLVAEVLSFFCYCEIPTGHTLVLEGFDQHQRFLNEHGRFDAWMRVLENTIDGRGRYGSMVDASDEFKKGGVGIDNALMDYVCILASVQGTRAYDFFLSAMQHLLLIRDDGEARTKYFQLIDSLVTQVVLDRHGLDQDWSQSVGLTVSQ
ncbi:11408_t:CDS:2, partial [Gigaspora rosea]